MIPTEYKGNLKIGTVEINQHCIVGANSTILPNVVLNTGSCVGANSLVNSNLTSWKLYAGVPAKIIKERDKNGNTKARKNVPG